jgi:hypothetical protein
VVDTEAWRKLSRTAKNEQIKARSDVALGGFEGTARAMSRRSPIAGLKEVTMDEGWVGMLMGSAMLLFAALFMVSHDRPEHPRCERCENSTRVRPRRQLPIVSAV